jgi:hypothetical protein
MSKIALTPNASGTGVFTISSPATNTDRTLTLPDEGGSIVVNTATGIDVTGNATFADNGKAIFGAGNDLEIYHDGTNNRLTFASANTYIQTDGIVHFTDIGNNEKHLTINDDGAVDLYHNNALKLATTATGIDVTGNVNVTGTDQFKANSSSSGDYVRMYGSSGTGKWDIYGNGANLRIGDNESLGGVMIDTKAAFGTSPSAWNASIFPGAIQLGGQGVLAATAVSAQFGLNWYYSDEYRYIGTGQASRIYHVAGALVFENASSGTADAAITWSESMQIDSSGNLLVGTTSADPTGVGSSGRVVINTRNGGQAALTCYNVGTGAVNIISLENVNGQVGRIQINGTATSYLTSSDYRLKEDWQLMSGASDRVLALKPVNFAWKVDGSRVDGFLAHEVAEVVPEAIAGTKDAMRDQEYEVTAAIEATYDEDGNELTAAVEAVMGTRSVPDMQGIDQSKLVPLLTAALQEALNKIEAMETRLAALEAV